MPQGTFETWLAAIATLACFSYLYKENPIYRFFEYIGLGLAAGHGAAFTWVNLTKNHLFSPASKQFILAGGEYHLLIAVLLGLLYYSIFIPKISWLYRYPVAVFVGYEIGRMFVFEPRPFITQVRDTFTVIAGKTTGATMNNIMFLIIFLTALSYFFFTVRRDNSVMRVSTTAGRWFLMLALGAAFGNTIMGRVSLFIGRIQFLLVNWLKLVS